MRSLALRAAAGVAAAILIFGAAPGCSRDPAAREARYLQRGKEMMRKRDVSHAIVEFANAVKIMPKDAEAHYQFALALLAADRAPQAIGSLQLATKLNPKHIEAQIKLAELMLQSRDDRVLQQAEERMSDVLLEMPDNPDAARALAIAEFKLGKGVEAQERLTRALERFPAHLQSAAALAQMKIAGHDLPGAEAVLRALADRLPQSVEAGLALAQFYVAAGRLPDAETETGRVLRIDGNSAPALLLQAAFQMERGRADEADRIYRKVAALPDSPFPHAHATFLLQQKRFDEAIAEFRSLAVAPKAGREARTRLVQAELAAGKTADAERDLDAALKKNPKDQDALLQRSRILLAGGRLDAAESDLQAILRLSPNSADAHFALARVLAAQGNDLRMRDELGEALKLRPELLAVRIELSRALLQARAPQPALDIMDAAPEFQKTVSDFVVARNWTLVAVGRGAEARVAVESALLKHKTPALLFQRGVFSFSDKKYAAARSDAMEVMAAEPANMRALMLAVEALLALRNPQEAERLARDTAARFANNPYLQTAAGDVFQLLGKPAEARRFYDSALVADANFSPAALALARFETAAGQTDAARTRLSELIRKNPRASAALMALANLEYTAGRRADAAEFYRRAAEADRRNVIALNNYAYLRAETDPDGALLFAQRALEAAPNSAVVLDTLGWIYYRKGLTELAVANLQRAMSREPTPRRQFHLGMAQLKLGQKEAGAENLNAALKRDATLTTTEIGW